MSIPTQTEMFPIVLSLATDGTPRSRKQFKEDARKLLNLTDEELEQTTSSGIPVYESRVGWAISYLSRAQLLDKVSRGVHQINDEGKQVAAEQLDGSNLFKKLNQMINERNPWNRKTDSEDNEPTQLPDNSETGQSISPQEAIDAAISTINADLAEQLIDQIMSNTPDFFEKLVVDLLEAMGYGKGEQTQYSNDGGIDGIITTDALGFDPIYTQAKRYAADNRVGRPEIQAFAGALGHYTRGIFITTSSFARNAIEYAKTYPHATIVLIDGRKLAELMIKYNLGVSTERTYQIKRIDIDYFEQD